MSATSGDETIVKGLFNRTAPVPAQKAMTLRLDSDLAEQLELVADVLDKPVSEVVRDAVAIHLVNLPPLFRLNADGVHFTFSHLCVWGEPKRTYRDTSTMPHGGGTWQVVQQEPLTVTPSIHCTACGTHGFITDGKWVAV